MVEHPFRQPDLFCCCSSIAFASLRIRESNSATHCAEYRHEWSHSLTNKTITDTSRPRDGNILQQLKQIQGALTDPRAAAANPWVGFYNFMHCIYFKNLQEEFFFHSEKKPTEFFWIFNKLFYNALLESGKYRPT